MTPKRPPGYMTEDLELRIVAGPPLYAIRTDGPVEHVTLQRASGEIMGYIYTNDDDDVAAWQPRAGASPEAWNDASFWMRLLGDAKARGRKPSEALDELLLAATPNSRIVPGSRATSPNLAALKTLAGFPLQPPASSSRSTNRTGKTE